MLLRALASGAPVKFPRCWFLFFGGVLVGDWAWVKIKARGRGFSSLVPCTRATHLEHRSPCWLFCLTVDGGCWYFPGGFFRYQGNPSVSNQKLDSDFGVLPDFRATGPTRWEPRAEEVALPLHCGDGGLQRPHPGGGDGGGRSPGEGCAAGGAVEEPWGGGVGWGWGVGGGGGRGGGEGKHSIWPGWRLGFFVTAACACMYTTRVD